MKKLLKPNLNRVDFNAQMHDQLDHFLEGLDRYNQSDRQKQTELCQLGKALITYFPNYRIKDCREQPDFIISDGNEDIGLEIQTIINPEIKKKHGFFENIFLLLEKELREENEFSNLLVTCYLKSQESFKVSEKQELLENLNSVIKHYIKNEELIENKLVRRISLMPHNQLSLHVNFGAFMVTDLDKGTLINFINKKNKKAVTYRKNTNTKQWLLLVTGNVEQASFDLENEIDLPPIESDFEKIYVMTDFDNNLFEIK